MHSWCTSFNLINLIIIEKKKKDGQKKEFLLSYNQMWISVIIDKWFFSFFCDFPLVNIRWFLEIDILTSVVLIKKNSNNELVKFNLKEPIITKRSFFKNMLKGVAIISCIFRQFVHIYSNHDMNFWHYSMYKLFFFLLFCLTCDELCTQLFNFSILSGLKFQPF